MKFALLDGSDPSTAGPSQGEVNDWLAFDKAVKDAGEGLRRIDDVDGASPRAALTPERVRLICFQVVHA